MTKKERGKERGKKLRQGWDMVKCQVTERCEHIFGYNWLEKERLSDVDQLRALSLNIDQ